MRRADMFGFPDYCVEHLSDNEPLGSANTYVLIENSATRVMKNILELEGNPSTESDIYALTTGSVKSWGLSQDLSALHIEEVLSLKKAMDFLLLNHTKQLTPEMVMLYNRLLLAGPKSSLSGELRSTNVFINGSTYSPPDFRDLNRLFVNMFNAVDALEGDRNKALSFLLGISKSQFFIDGNKRTARMVCMHQLCYAQQKILSPFLDTQQYLKLLKEFYESGSNLPLVKFLEDNFFSLEDID